MKRIQDKGYVNYSKGSLIPTLTGYAVVQFLEKYYSDLVNLQYTSTMEDELDLISLGKKSKEGNVIEGDNFVDSSSNCLVLSRNKYVGIVGVNDLIVIDTEDALLITKRGEKKSTQKMKILTEGATKTESGLAYFMIKKGEGAQATQGKIVSVHYTGKLADGTKFDSSYDRNAPIEFPLGEGRVIQGWDEGISLLKVGGKATFIIPPHLAYGEKGAGGVIPPNATLIFDVELMDVK
jgi:peptidyl-prolyl cis-trans isomerase A (cyclophilin A)